MKKHLFAILVVVCSVISIVICRSALTFVNLFLSAVALCMSLFVRNSSVQMRVSYGAMWLFVLELLAIVVHVLGTGFLGTSYAWLMYVVFIVLEIVVTPKIANK